MGWATWMSGYVAPGARVVLDYLGPLRAGDEVELQANLERVDGRNLFLKAELRVDGRAKVRAHGRFVAVTPRDWTAFAGWPGLERFLEA
jgi:acyl-CoA thioesterase FadM